MAKELVKEFGRGYELGYAAGKEDVKGEVVESLSKILLKEQRKAHSAIGCAVNFTEARTKDLMVIVKGEIRSQIVSKLMRSVVTSFIEEIKKLTNHTLHRSRVPL